MGPKPNRHPKRPRSRSTVGRILVLLMLLGSGSAQADAATDSLALDEILQSLPDQEQIDWLHQEIQRTMRNDPKHAMILARRALAISEERADDRARFHALLQIGVSYYYQGQYKPALRYYENALALTEQMEDKSLAASARNNIGVLYFVWGEHNEALEHYLEALTILLELDDTEGIARAYNNIAGVHQTAGRFDSARDFFQLALDRYRKIGNRTFEASTLNNIGLVQFEQGNMDEAMRALGEARLIERESGDRSGEALSLHNMGMIRASQERLDDANRYYTSALAIRREISDRQGESATLQAMGGALVQAGEVGKGIGLLESALEISREMEIQEMIRDCLLDLSEAYEIAGQFDKALEYAKLHRKAHDRIFDEMRTRQMAAAEARFELDLKDHEIDGLHRDAEYEKFRRKIMLAVAGLLLIIIALLWNRYRFQRQGKLEIQAKNEALRLAHAELEKAARVELAHVSRVATMGELAAAFAHELNQPLTAIKANARAARNLLGVEESDRIEVDEALQDIRDDAERAREIILRLREMMRKGDELRETCDINSIARKGVSFIEPSAREQGVSIRLDLAEGLAPVLCDRIQLQQVLLNLVQNSLAAMGREGEILIRSGSTAEGRISVRVRDEGPKLPAEILADMFHPFFTTKNEGLGMGLPICRTIIKAHGGKIVARRNEDRGLTVEIELPAAE